MVLIDFSMPADPQRIDILSFILNYLLVIFAHSFP